MSYTPRHSATPRDSITANPSATHRHASGLPSGSPVVGPWNVGWRYGCNARKGPLAPERFGKFPSYQIRQTLEISCFARAEREITRGSWLQLKLRTGAGLLLIPRAPKFCRIARPLIPWCKNHGFRSPRFRPGARPQQQAHGRAVASAAARTLHPLHLAMFQEPWQVAP